jgi:hypothetical protein
VEVVGVVRYFGAEDVGRDYRLNGLSPFENYSRVMLAFLLSPVKYETRSSA